MSEYIEIESETTDDPAVITIYTNLTLADAGLETYDSVLEMEEGSPLAQALAHVPGVRSLFIQGTQLTVTRDLSVPWHVIVADVSTAIKDFFL